MCAPANAGLLDIPVPRRELDAVVGSPPYAGCGRGCPRKA
jgi:hypothetical protein